MKISASEDIKAPIAHVFRMCSDFDGFERLALRRKIDVTRRVALKHPRAERGWDVRFKLRGKLQDVVGELVGFDPPNGMVFATEAEGITGEIRLDLVSLSRQRTRMSFSVDLRPSSIRGQLRLQLFGLVKTRLANKFRDRVGGFAGKVENAQPGV